MQKIIIQSIEKELPNRLLYRLTVGDQEEEAHIEVDKMYADYLVTDRIDSLVWGLLQFAINRGYDIESTLPITEDLWYNLEMNLIDPLAANPGMHRIHIQAPLVPVMNHAKIVATGISCGVDSLYTIATHGKKVPKPYRLTHLCFFDAGSHNTGLQDNSSTKLFQGRMDLCRRFAEEYNYGFILIKNDIYELLNRHGGYSHVENHTFMALSCIYALQGAFAKYFYSAGCSIREFSCVKQKENSQLDAAHYDMLTLNSASIPGLDFISTGGSLDRITKTKTIADYAPAYKYLNVCVTAIENDSTCFKCVRTMLTLDALGKLDKFSAVFDVQYYMNHRKKYIERMYADGKFGNDEFLLSLFPLFKSELTIRVKISAFIHKVQNAVRCRIFKK
ncbi:hypothetical protein [Phocaeicola vulgatus]|uniref:hypothetical protein n=1 Tax=Phocaeicola vulgatus TaxID=821 RepID=UPI0032BFFFFF